MNQAVYSFFGHIFAQCMISITRLQDLEAILPEALSISTDEIDLHFHIYNVVLQYETLHLQLVNFFQRLHEFKVVNRLKILSRYIEEFDILSDYYRVDQLTVDLLITLLFRMRQINSKPNIKFTKLLQSVRETLKKHVELKKAMNAYHEVITNKGLRDRKSKKEQTDQPNN